MSLNSLIQTKRVILCVGSGGVGKTTTAAALGLAAASQGKRALCLTIDPARRLAQSLGLSEMKTDAQLVDPSRLTAAGLSVPGSLTVMMLDTKRTFDELVTRYASSREAGERILSNKLYQYVSTSLAGTQEYMAMEKLHAIKLDPAYDLIILDTPPTSNALDFLDAPERMIDALDSAVMRWFVSAFETSGKLSLNLLARSTALVLRAIGRLTGRGFLDAMAQFIIELNDLFGGFKKRAQEVAAALRGSEVAYVLVTSPDPMSIREVLYFSERLRELGMPRDAFVVNRLHPRHLGHAEEAEIQGALDRSGIVLEDGGAGRVAQADRDAAMQGELDARHLTMLGEAMHGPAPPLRVEVPAYGNDVHDVSALANVARVLMG